MKALVRFLLIFICMKLIVSKPQHLQEQAHYNLDPLNEPQFEYPPKDPAKRTLGRHYALGRHVGIHPSGFKYFLGYTPINIKYVPVTKPVTVLKPVLHQNIKPLWRPVVTPPRLYLPSPVLHVHKPVHHLDHSWKPIVPVQHPVAPPHQVQHIHSVVDQPVPVQQVQHLVPALPAAPAFPVAPALPAAPAFPVAPALPPVPALPAAFPIKPPFHNYFYFQTPIARPALLPQHALFHVTRPHLPVLPLGASFPSPILQPSGQGLVHLPAAPVAPIPAPPVAPVHHHPVAVHPALPAPPAVPVHHPVFVHPQPAPPVVPFHQQPVPPTVPFHPQPASPALPPVSVEYHGNHHLVPFNNQIPFTAAHPYQPSVPFQPSVPLPVLPLPKTPVQTPQIGRQPHAFPLPPEVQHDVHQQAPFNPDAAIQPGQTDLQFPMHLPDHPFFKQVPQVPHLQPTGTLEPPFPPFQNPGNILRPSISLEPPLTHGYNR